MPSKLKLETIIDRANKIHNYKYDYSLISDYNGVMDKYSIKCLEHGVWETSLDNHVTKKSGCPKCKGFNHSFNEKIDRANKIHNYKYDYSLIYDIKFQDNYEFICKTCSHVFSNSWSNHVHKKQGCPKCNPSGRKKRTLESIKKQISDLNTGYEYNWKTYKNYFSNEFEIKCPKHGWFTQQLSNHLQGQRCPKCKRSKGEEIIENFLTENNIIYETQKTFEGCKNKRMLPFDFYIPSKNLCIEYDGELHSKPVDFFGGEISLKQTQHNDQIKNKFCEDNNISLIRISYINFNNIQNILSNEI
jgi:Zn finger protein HypA/HybF involved in hydrogenase expression